MTSLMFREYCLFAKENHSKLYVRFLDVQKAFDKIWHNGLFLKLYEKGVQSIFASDCHQSHNQLCGL